MDKNTVKESLPRRLSLSDIDIEIDIDKEDDNGRNDGDATRLHVSIQVKCSQGEKNVPEQDNDNQRDAIECDILSMSLDHRNNERREVWAQDL